MTDMKFYGQFNPPLDKVLYEKYFKDFKGDGICLECGAVDGINISSTYFFEETLGWKAINIEPHPDSFKKLVENRKKSININLALSDKNADAYLVTGPRFFLRAYTVDEHRNNSVPIKKSTYRDILKTLPIDHIDLMVLDVESHEKEALNGMIGAEILPRVLCVEINHVGKNVVKEIVTKMGYVFDSSIFINDVYVRKYECEVNQNDRS